MTANWSKVGIFENFFFITYSIFPSSHSEIILCEKNPLDYIVYYS